MRSMNTPSVNITTFSAANTPTAGASNAAALQAAINARGVGGGRVLMPKGRYRIDGTVTLNLPVTVQGAGRPSNIYQTIVRGAGTALYRPRDATVPMFSVGSFAQQGGLCDFSMDEGYDSAPTVGAPLPAFLVDGLDVGDFHIDNVAAYRCMRALNFMGGGRVNITEFYHDALHTGIALHGQQDVGVIRHVHSWPFSFLGGATPEELAANLSALLYRQANSASFRFKRVDGLWVDETFSLGVNRHVVFEPYNDAQGDSSVIGARHWDLGRMYADFACVAFETQQSRQEGVIGSIRAQGERFVHEDGSPHDGSTFGNGSVPILIGGVENNIDLGALRAERWHWGAIVLSGTGHNLIQKGMQLRWMNQSSQPTWYVCIDTVAGSGSNLCHTGPIFVRPYGGETPGTMFYSNIAGFNLYPSFYNLI